MLKWLRGTPPRVGSVWTLRGDSDPFDGPVIVEVVAVKAGYVQYQFQFGTPSSRTVRSFRLLYRETA